MKVFYDTEFLEDGYTIELISIGMVTEDGREYYAVNRQAPWKRIKEHTWLMENVVPDLPKDPTMPSHWLVNFDDPCVKPKQHISYEVRNFLRATTDLELWAWYGAYDHVVLCQLFGRMIDLPPGVPMWTHDLNELVERNKDKIFSVPKQVGVEHNALEDARHIRELYQHFTS